MIQIDAFNNRYQSVTAISEWNKDLWEKSY